MLKKFMLVTISIVINNLALAEDFDGQFTKNITEIRGLAQAHEAKDFISDLYLQLFIKNYSNEEIAQGTFHSDLLDMVTKIAKMNSGETPDEISCGNYFIWLLGAQDYPINVRSGNMDWASKLEVELSWSESNQTKITLELRRVNDAWKILNIYYDRGDLKSMFKRCLKYDN